MLVPHGSGPSTARGRRALATALSGSLGEALESLELGAVGRIREIDTGTHHIVWKVSAGDRDYAMRASARANQTNRVMRERLWLMVGRAGVAPEYRGSLRVRTRIFDGWLEVFDWIHGRHLRPTKDHRALARTLAGLHSIPIPRKYDIAPRVGLRRFIIETLTRDLRDNRARGPIDRLLSERTTQSLAAVKAVPMRLPRAVLVHDDLVDANVIPSDGTVHLIDWDWAMITQPEVDIFCFLSPFVRSWGAKPSFLKPQIAADFCKEYLTDMGPRTKVDPELWSPYNTLLANWLRRQRNAPPHARPLDFYERAFHEVGKLSAVLESLK